MSMKEHNNYLNVMYSEQDIIDMGFDEGQKIFNEYKGADKWTTEWAYFHNTYNRIYRAEIKAM